MARLGADIEQMEQLARVFEREANNLRHCASTVNSMIRDVAWFGPFHDFFLFWWNSSEYREIVGLADQMVALGASVRAQAHAQSIASTPTTRGSVPTGIGDDLPPRLLSQGTFAGGNKLGVVGEYIPEWEVGRSTYMVKEDGVYVVKGNASVLTSTQFGLDAGDIEGVMLVVPGGGVGALATRVVDSLWIDAHLDGSVAVGGGIEYRWYDRSDADTINNFLTQKAADESTKWLGFDPLDHGDIVDSFKDGRIPPADSVVVWAIADFEASAKFGFGADLLPSVDAGVETSMRAGVESFSNGDVGSILRYDSAGSGQVGWGVRVEGEAMVSGEIKLIRDEAGQPIQLTVTEKSTAVVETGSTHVLSEMHGSGEIVTTVHTFDLSDPTVNDALRLSSNDDLPTILQHAQDNSHLALGERYVGDVGTGSVDFDYLWTVGMDSESESSFFKSAMIKPMGSSDFEDWPTD